MALGNTSFIPELDLGDVLMPGPMAVPLIDRYRCPDTLLNFGLTAPLSEDAGFFQVGKDALGYGRSAAGYRSKNPGSTLYDVRPDITTDGSGVLLPFDPVEIIDNLRLERYAARSACSRLNGWQRALKTMYYLLRPGMPVPVRKHLQRAYLRGWEGTPFPAWPVDATVERILEELLFHSMKASGVEKMPFVWFWPDGAKSCVILTHDVEGPKGYDACGALMDLDDSFAMKASFQMVPEGSYKISAPGLDEIRRRGFEINIQDLNHDGRLYRDRAEFVRRVQKINSYGDSYGARGFRAAVLYRNQDWYDLLDFSFDMSVPNVAHLDPQRGGCCTVMPYFIGELLEIPLTTTQDYMLFHLLNDFSLDLWKQQVGMILEKNGLISLLVHPDYVVEEKTRNVYKSLLDFLRQLALSESLWFALPGEVNDWWRARSKMRVVEHAGRWKVEGPGAERAVVAYAKISGDRLEYERAPQFHLVRDGGPSNTPREANAYS
jgi:hypothetical protein